MKFRWKRRGALPRTAAVDVCSMFSFFFSEWGEVFSVPYWRNKTSLKSVDKVGEDIAQKY